MEASVNLPNPNQRKRTPSRVLKASFFALGLAVLSIVFFQLVPPYLAGPTGPAQSGPRLAVLVVFDQMRADYLTRWNMLFGADGFHRLEREGAWFTNCNLPYAQTMTAPGHASLSTGTSPSHHGIVGNTWYDRATGTEVYCVETDRYELVPLIRGRLKEEVGEWPGFWPGWLQAETLGDALKRATGGKGRVVSLALKDRAAVLLGSAKAQTDACYWYFRSAGTFVTSTYYRPDGKVHPWVAEFNRGRPADPWFGKQWTRLRPDLDYARYSGPDDVPGEDTGWVQGRTFPHPLTGGLRKPGKNFYRALANSPVGNELLLDLAKRALAGEGLGTREEPDLLCVSFSSNDLIGHCWGPDSQEVLDVTLRSDRIIADLLNDLDAHVGRGRYVLAVTADHGVCPLPDVARSHGKDAGRVSEKVFKEEAEAYLKQTLPGGADQGNWIQATTDLWIYLNPARVRGAGLRPERVQEALASWLERQPGVLRAYPRSRLLGGPLAGDPIGERVRRSFHPQRSGDVGVVLKPYYQLGTPLDRGTGHGSPHAYDTHVPLLVYGPGIRAGVRAEAVSPLTVKAILTRGLHLPAPAGAGAPLPSGLYE